MKVLTKYFNKNTRHIAILIDPEKHSQKSLSELVLKVDKSEIDLIFVGSSLSSEFYHQVIESIKDNTSKPVVLFPGNSLQLSNKADGLLNLSLISGRNAELLIGEHVRSAMFLKESKLQLIPTGYMLIDGGSRTSVEYMSNTQSIPRDKIDIAIATAVAGEFLGLKCIYLEAGSGAQFSVPNSTVKAVAENISIPVICGGGIKTKKEIQDKWKSGANVVVIGSAFEDNPKFLDEFSL